MERCRGDEGSEVYVVVDSAANFYVWYRLLQSMAQLKLHTKNEICLHQRFTWLLYRACRGAG